MLTPIEPEDTLIGLCERLAVLHQASNAADDLMTEDQDDDIDPIMERWFEVAARVRQLDAPTTLEGARAVASVLLLLYPDGIYPQNDLVDWLALRCAQYLIREAPA